MNLLLIVIAVFLIAHGLIHVYFVTPAPPPGPVKWPFQLDHSWLLAPLGLDRFARPIGMGLLILTVGGFAATALGLLGVPLFHEWWEILALASAAVSFLMLVLFWNLMLVFGIVIDAAIVAAVLWNPSPLQTLGLAVTR